MKIEFSDQLKESAATSEYCIDSSIAFELAEEEGLEVVLPDDYTLQLDIDSDIQYAEYEERFPFFERFFSIKSIEIKPSKNGLPHQHITIKLENPVTNRERIFLQLMLGSHYKREIYSFFEDSDRG